MAKRFIYAKNIDSYSVPERDNDYYFKRLVDDIVYDIKREKSSKKKIYDWYYVFNEEQLYEIIKKLNNKFELIYEINKEQNFIRIKLVDEM